LFYPYQFVRNSVAKWALCKDEYCQDKYGDWFNCIMKWTIPSVVKPLPLTIKQKHQMKMPVLLFLGTNDLIVDDAQKARLAAESYPNIQIEIKNSGHLISVEHRDFVNKKAAEFLKLHQK
jgi:pimeloyl-ACP methyl ester carboxylesterase